MSTALSVGSAVVWREEARGVLLYGLITDILDPFLEPTIVKVRSESSPAGEWIRPERIVRPMTPKEQTQWLGTNRSRTIPYDPFSDTAWKRRHR